MKMAVDITLILCVRVCVCGSESETETGICGSAVHWAYLVFNLSIFEQNSYTAVRWVWNREVLQKAWRLAIQYNERRVLSKVCRMRTITAMVQFCLALVSRTTHYVLAFVFIVL